MTPTPRLHELVVAAPDGASALALEYRLSHLCPVTILGRLRVCSNANNDTQDRSQ